MKNIAKAFHYYRFIQYIKRGRDCLKGKSLSEVKKLVPENLVIFHKINEGHTEILVNIANPRGQIYYISLFFGKVIENY